MSVKFQRVSWSFSRFFCLLMYLSVSSVTQTDSNVLELVSLVGFVSEPWFSKRLLANFS